MSSEIVRDKNQNAIVVIREATPNYEEGILYAQFLNEASEGFFKSILGNETYEIISEAYVKSNNEYSFENALFIDYNNEIVGMISGYTKTKKLDFVKNILRKTTKGSKFKLVIFSIVGRVLSHFLGPRENEEFYIQAIALNNHMRGKGLGQRLLKYIADRSKNYGCRTLSLDVSSKNIRAIKSYNRFGMKVSSQWPNFLNLPSVFTRMEKQL